MSHRIDFDGLTQKLFLLQNLCFSSKNYCKYNEVNRDNNIGYERWIFYLFSLKTYLSETLLDCAIKIRVIQDIFKSEGHSTSFLNEIDEQCTSGLVIGKYENDGAHLRIRESCNKIIHAESFHLNWIDVESEHESYTYWNGKININGFHHSNEWNIELDSIQFCQGTVEFVDRIQEEVDWYRIYKYDW